MRKSYLNYKFCVMKRILVTGNEGYIGSVLTRKLLERGYEVVGIDTGIFRDARFGSPRMPPHRQIYKDIRDVTAQDFEGIDAIIHLAALSNDPLGHFKPEITYDINWRASVRIAKLAKQARVKRFLFSSSCSLYGVAGDAPVTEEAALRPQTPYAESKVYAERDIKPLGDEHFCPIFLRNATVFGISPRLRLDLVVQDLSMRGYLNGVITILSDGTPWRPLVHIEDVSSAFIFFLEAPREKVFAQAFNIGKQENNIRVSEIADMVHNALSGTCVKIKNENPLDTRSYRVDFSKLYALGFLPRHSVADGIAEVVSAFTYARISQHHQENDHYHTLSRYQNLIAQGKLDNELRLHIIK